MLGLCAPRHYISQDARPVALQVKMRVVAIPWQPDLAAEVARTGVWRPDSFRPEPLEPAEWKVERGTRSPLFAHRPGMLSKDTESHTFRSLTSWAAGPHYTEGESIAAVSITHKWHTQRRIRGAYKGGSVQAKTPVGENH